MDPDTRGPTKHWFATRDHRHALDWRRDAIDAYKRFRSGEAIDHGDVVALRSMRPTEGVAGMLHKCMVELIATFEVVGSPQEREHQLTKVQCVDVQWQMFFRYSTSKLLFTNH